MDIIEQIRLHIFECEGAPCQEMEPDPIPLLLACRDEIISARACAEMMLQGTGQRIGEECARRVMEQHYPPKWIPVSVRLPEEGQQVLAYSDRMHGSVSSGSVCVFNGGTFQGLDWLGTVNATHWMPLPAPPTDAKWTANAKDEQRRTHD